MQTTITQISLEDIFLAYYDCRKNKRKKPGAREFEIDLEADLIRLWEDINKGNWQPGCSTVFIVKDPVVREIFAAPFRDRIVHHLVINKINPLFERVFINDSYSCRVGKGTHFGVARAEKYIRRYKNGYVLKLDIQGYFMNISRDILYNKLQTFINENYLQPDKEIILQLVEKIVKNDPTIGCVFNSPPEDWSALPRDKSLFHTAKNCGIPIGNLTSQIFANFYLNDLDHFVRSLSGMKFYGRYVDDCILVHTSGYYLKGIIPYIRGYLHNELGLTLHPKKIYLQPCCKGVKFLGCFIKPTHTVTNHRTIKNFKHRLFWANKLVVDHKPSKREVERFVSSVNSYLGIMKHYKTFEKRWMLLENHISTLWKKHIKVSIARFDKIVRRK